jgi:hypothetical protein
MSDLRSLLEAAKADAPSAAAKAKVWGGISGAIGEAASLAGGGAAAGSAGATKLLVLGTLLGGSLTIGLGAVALFMTGGSPTQAGGRIAMAAPAPATSAPPPLVAPEGRRPDSSTQVSPSSDGPPMPEAQVPSATAAALAVHSAHAVPPEAARKATVAARAGANTPPGGAFAAGHGTVDPRSDGDDALAREASMLAEARNALIRRDALSALQIVRGIRALPARQLVPEELAVEAQALRALGLNDDANAVDVTLRSRFPDSVLGR